MENILLSEYQSIFENDSNSKLMENVVALKNEIESQQKMLAFIAINDPSVRLCTVTRYELELEINDGTAP